MGRVESKGAQQIANGILARGGAWLLLGAVVVAALWPFRGYVTDDTYIHLQFARNLAQGYGFAFEEGRQVYGFTSPLWVMLLGAAERLGLPGLPAARVLGLFFTFASIAGVHALSKEWMRDRRFVWTATIAWALDAWLLRWTYSGMETSLAVSVVVWAFVLHARAREGRGSVFAALAGAALLAVVRPEGLALAFLVWIDLSFFPVPRGEANRVPSPFPSPLPSRRPELAGEDRGPSRPGGSRRVRAALVGLVPVAAIVGPWFVYAGSTFGQILPTSIAAKSPSFLWKPADLLERVTLELSILGATRAVELMLLLASVAVLTVSLRRGRVGRDTLRALRDRYRLVLLWFVAILVPYIVRDSGLVSRYLMVLTPILTALSWSVVETVLATGDVTVSDTGNDSRRSPWWGRATVLIALSLLATASLNAWVLYGRTLSHVTEFSSRLESSMGAIADWLRTNTPDSSSVASPDIGLLGYRLLDGQPNRHLVDLSGIVTPEMLALHQGRYIEDFILDIGFAPLARPDYVIDRDTEPRRLPEVGPHGERIEVALVREIGPLGVARPGPYYYTLYRIDWSEARSPSGTHP